MTDLFQSKKALVIGGSGGIGKEIALGLSKAGADVVVQGAHEGRGADIVLDFTKLNPEEFFSTSNPLTDALSIADLLCICYGPFLQKKLEDTTPGDWIAMSKLNLALPGILAGYAAPFMKKRGFGRLLFFGGTKTASINGFRTVAAYSAAKTGIASLAKSFALEYGDSGITSNAVFPGFVKTEYVTEEQQKYYEGLLGAKMLDAEYVAHRALSLISDPGSNGILLEIDGGWKGQKK